MSGLPGLSKAVMAAGGAWACGVGASAGGSNVRLDIAPIRLLGSAGLVTARTGETATPSGRTSTNRAKAP